MSSMFEKKGLSSMFEKKGKRWGSITKVKKSQYRPETIYSINSRIELKMLNRNKYFIMSQLNSYRYYVEFTSRGMFDPLLINNLEAIEMRAKFIKKTLHVHFRQEVTIYTYEAEEYPKEYINTKMGFSNEDIKRFIETISYHNNDYLELNLCKISHTMGNASYMFEKYVKQKLILYCMKSANTNLLEIIDHLYAVFEHLLLRHDEDTATVNLLCYAIRKNIIQ